MKKKLFSDKKTTGASKGFYAALGISAVMIGSACYFAYSESRDLRDEKLSAQNKSITSEEAVDKKYTDIPKITSPVVTSAQTVTTAVAAQPAQTSTHTATLPAAGITVSEPPSETASASDTPAGNNAGTLENVSAPLNDVSALISPFSGTELVKNETTGSWQTHNGADFAAEVGAEVYVISSGEVTAVNDDPLWGTVVVVDHHNGFISRYCGLSKELSVQLGDTLSSGEMIGVIGETADIESALEPHLHIEVTHNGNYQDPAALFE